MFGAPDNVAVTAAPFSYTSIGVMTVLQSPLTVPTQVQGTASQTLRITSQYSSMVFEIGSASVMALTATGLVMQTPFVEMPSGVTGMFGTQGAQPLVLRTNTLNRWAVDASGMFAPVVSNLDIGSLAGPNPRNVYVGSNLILGGNLQLGSAVFAPISSDAQGDILYRGATTWTRLAAGTAGYVLSTGGAAANPSWVVGSSGILTSTDPVAWTGTHSWSKSASFNFSSAGAKVGIGTSTPTLMLDVFGNANIASNLLVSGNVGIGTGVPTAPLHVSGATYHGGNVTTASTILLAQMTSGSVPFISNNGYLSQNNAQFFWDNTNNFFGIGTAVPTVSLHVPSSVYFGPSITIASTILFANPKANSIPYVAADGSLGLNSQLTWNSQSGMVKAAFFLGASGLLTNVSGTASPFLGGVPPTGYVGLESVGGRLVYVINGVVRYVSGTLS